MAQQWFAQQLVDWQRTHGRHDLPWNGACDAYLIWLSEIMLQQTQVSRVIDYFNRFVARFPDVDALAAVTLDDVMPLWSGLGYYARCRHLHDTACRVSKQYGGIFPDDVDTLCTFSGIGRSTAGAICAFAYGQHQPICDGNVKRVLARFYGIDAVINTTAGEQVFWQYAERNTPKNNVSIYTQAIMDLGATLCTRTNPDCARCPVTARCIARVDNAVHDYPKRKQKQPKPAKAFCLYVVCDADKGIWLEQRDGASFWPHLFCLPMQEATTTAYKVATYYDTVQHQFTHFSLTMTVYLLPHLPSAYAKRAGRWCNCDVMDETALPAPIKRLIVRLCNQQS